MPLRWNVVEALLKVKQQILLRNSVELHFIVLKASLPPYKPVFSLLGFEYVIEKVGEIMEKDVLDSTAKFDSARDSTTLAVNTEKNSVVACVDWVSCSFQFAGDLQKIFNLIGISDLSTLEKIDGARYEFAGYNITYRIGFIELMYYHDHEDNSDNWFLNMSGQGCREFEIASCFDFITLFGILANVDAVYTRLDIALDDFNNIFTVDQFRNAVYNKQCVTKLRTWGDHRRGKIATGLDDVQMNNFYLGSSTSRYFLNVYDKKLERESKKIEVLHKTWVRTEVRFKYEYADDFIVHLLQNDGELGSHITAFLNAHITFLKPSVITKFLAKETGYTNRSRLADDLKNHARWWRDFLNNTKTLHLTKRKPEKTLDDSKQWVYKQVAITLAMLKEYNPKGFNAFIDVAVAKGLNKMQEKHQRKIDNQRYLDKQVISFGDWLEKEEKYNDGVKKSTKVKDRNKLLDIYWEQAEEQQKKSAIN